MDNMPVSGRPGAPQPQQPLNRTVGGLGPRPYQGGGGGGVGPVPSPSPRPWQGAPGGGVVPTPSPGPQPWQGGQGGGVAPTPRPGPTGGPFTPMAPPTRPRKAPVNRKVR